MTIGALLSTGPAVAQFGLALAALAAATLAPPASGAMLLLPLPGVSLAVALDIATRNGARLVVAGPIARSAVVRGERARIAPPLLAHGILTLAAPAAWCGA